MRLFILFILLTGSTIDWTIKKDYVVSKGTYSITILAPTKEDIARKELAIAEGIAIKEYVESKRISGRNYGNNISREKIEDIKESVKER